MEETELLVYALVGFLENCKEDNIKQLKGLSYANMNAAQKFGIDQAKILKTATKHYKILHSNPSMLNLILNYFNSK